MDTSPSSNSRTLMLLDRAREGDPAALDELFGLHRERLRRMVELRLDRRLRGRLDASDVVQETCLEASRRLPQYLQDRPMPFFLWLRFLTVQKVLALHQHHLGVKQRDPRREVSLDQSGGPGASSAALAARLLGQRTSPSQAAARAELKAAIQAALESMDPVDREVLTLRHFELLSNLEAAQVLGIQPSAASKRYLRAAKRLRGLLAGLENAPEGPWK